MLFTVLCTVKMFISKLKKYLFITVNELFNRRNTNKDILNKNENRQDILI